jgi:hypothetical protein
MPKLPSPWKAGERKNAEIITDLGYGQSRRVPVSGRSRGDAPDIANPRFSIEQKHRRKLPKLVTDAFDQAVKSIRGEQVPIVILHEHGTRYLNSLVVVRLRDLPHIFPIDETDGRQRVPDPEQEDPGDLQGPA